MAGDTVKAAKAKRLLSDWALNGFKIVPVTFEIADLAASLRAKRGGRLPGALIVATAINQSANLVYSQDKDLQRYNQDIKICELPLKSCNRYCKIRDKWVWCVGCNPPFGLVIFGVLYAFILPSILVVGF